MVSAARLPGDSKPDAGRGPGGDHGVMVWSISTEPAEFAAAAGPFLRSEPVRHTVELSIVGTLLEHGAGAYGPADLVSGWWQPSGSPVGATFLQTPPYPLLLSGAPDEAASGLADLLAGAGRMLPGVNSVQGTAGRFAARWAQRTGASAAVHQRTRLHRLATLVPPRPPPPGAARTATTADRGLLLDWMRRFHQEIGMLAEGDPAPRLDEALSWGGMAVWEDGGEVVSMASRYQEVAGTTRVSFVYTPPALRRRGYAAAVTAAVTAAALDAGVAEVLLFTDLANPTSNGIYQRLGYRPVEDRVVLAFAAS